MCGLVKWRIPICWFSLEMHASYVIYTIKQVANHYLWGVNQEYVQLFLKYPGIYTYWVDCVMYWSYQAEGLSSIKLHRLVLYLLLAKEVD